MAYGRVTALHSTRLATLADFDPLEGASLNDWIDTIHETGNTTYTISWSILTRLSMLFQSYRQHICG